MDHEVDLQQTEITFHKTGTPGSHPLKTLGYSSKYQQKE